MRDQKPNRSLRSTFIAAFVLITFLAMSCGKKDGSVSPSASPAVLAQIPFGKHSFSYVVGTIQPNLGDLDIAYALVLADRQWGSATGDINYLQEAKNIIQAALAIEVNPTNRAIFLGDFVDPAQPNFYYGTRPSDFMPDHFRIFQSVTGDTAWAAVINKIYSVIDTIQTNNSPGTGLISDFVINTNRRGLIRYGLA